MMDEIKIGRKKNGGARPGAGRKKGASTIASENSRAYVMKRIEEELGPIIDAQIAAAKGLCYQDKRGKVYTKLPDLKAGEFLVNQNIGRAKESVEVISDIQLKVDM